MATYRVSIPVLTEVTVTVEAEDAEAAIESIDPADLPDTCSHCAHQGVGSIDQDAVRWDDATATVTTPKEA